MTVLIGNGSGGKGEALQQRRGSGDAEMSAGVKGPAMRRRHEGGDCTEEAMTWSRRRMAQVGGGRGEAKEEGKKFVAVVLLETNVAGWNDLIKFSHIACGRIP
jgi:hypothetical protein